MPKLQPQQSRIETPTQTPAVKPRPAKDAKPERLYRMRRKQGGWIVRYVEVLGDKVVAQGDVHEWDGFAMTERRLVGLASDIERDYGK